MPMPPRFTTDELLDHALALFADGGMQAVTVAGVARQAGAPSGSLYHRFAGRDALVAHLWLRTVQRFQQGYLQALDDEDPQRAAQRATRHVLRWVRAHPAEGLLLLRHRSSDLIGEHVAADLRDRDERGRRRLEQAIAAWRRRHPAAPDPVRTRFALVDLPLAAVRPYLQSGEPIPSSLDDLVMEALDAILA